MADDDKCRVDRSPAVLETSEIQTSIKAVDVHHIKDKRPNYVRDNPEWHMLTSRN